MTVTYKYDADGLRTQKTVNGVVYNYGYENGKLVYERKGNEYEVIYRYDADGNLFTVNRCIFSSGYTSLLYAVNNTRGDVVALYKGGGGRYSTYTYDSWGKPVVEATGMSAENSVRYRGYVYDQETGLYYLQSRYYDPETGRFLNADDVDYIGYSGEQLSYNAFAYCENNAVNSEDIEGFAGEVVLNNYEVLFNSFSALLSSVAMGVETVAIIVVIALVIEIVAKAVKHDTASLKTKYLQDVAAKLQDRDMPVYRFAYVDNLTNDLVITYKYMTFVEVLTVLGVSDVTYSLDKIYSIQDKRPIIVKSQIWGVHSNLQIHAKLLATVLGWNKCPEVHRSGYYGHYHDANRIIHIWYGQKIFY